MKVLGIETSCDESAAAVVADGTRILSNVISSQVDLHARFGGVVPEVASRAHVESINGCVQEALDCAELASTDIDAIAVTNRPGLIGSLLVGLCAAKAYAFVWDKPLIGVHHIEGHLHASFLTDPRPEFPYVALVASGGHSDIVHVRGHGEYEPLGRTRDDAAGEAFDKVARLLGLGHPGGPRIDREARECPGEGEPFPEANLGGSLDFSYSGVKTAVARAVERLSEEEIAKRRRAIAKGFQEAVIGPLVRNTLLAAKRSGLRRIVIGGGVAANSRLRERLTEEAARRGLELFLPPPFLCTDNAAMIAAVGCFALAAGRTDDLTLDAQATAPLTLPALRPSHVPSLPGG